MRRPHDLIYIHLVWCTWDRLPLLSGERKDVVHACIRSTCENLKTRLVALGGVEDHIHLLAQIPATAAVATLVKRVKGASSRLANETSPWDTIFKWQGAYGAFSISPWDVKKVQKYILNQEEHHRFGKLKPIFEQMDMS